MNEDSQEPTPETSQGAEALQIERRSVDLVLQGAQAIGEVSAGLGTLAIGVSQLKKRSGAGSRAPRRRRAMPRHNPPSRTQAISAATCSAASTSDCGRRCA
jgi:hypothetical protein